MRIPLAKIIAVVIPVSLLLLLIAPKSFMRGSAEMGSCLENLKQIEGASIAYMLETKKNETDSCSLTNKEIVAMLRGGVLPVCPSGGSYLLGKTFNDEPSCSVHGSLSKITADLPSQRFAELKRVAMVVVPVIALIVLLCFWQQRKVAIAA